MNYVRAAIDWIKSNPISLVCIIVAVVALVSFIYPTHSWASAFRDSLTAKGGDITKIDGLLKTEIAVPPQNASIGEKSDPITGVVTAADTEELKRIYGSIDTEYKGVLEFVQEFNRDGYDQATDKFETNPHVLMLPDELFPKPKFPPSKNKGKYAYSVAIEALYASLDAGEPLDQETRTKAEEDAERKFMNLFVPAYTQQDLVGEVRSQANQEIAETLQRKYQQHALDHHIYAPRVELSRSGAADAKWDTGPFYVEAWVKAVEPPGMADLWHGQVHLWIQQDLVAALRLVNHMDDTKTTLIEQPVKELEMIEVVETYVGLGSTGTSRGGAAPGPGGTGAAAAESGPTVQTDEAYENALKEGVKTDFLRSQSPTGRISNALYDVHHARMAVVIDYNRIPELFDALRKVNFMTVLDVRMEDVDEFEKFMDGYFYGHGVDAVHLDLTVEVIFLRQWTVGHNSEALAKKLGEKPDDGWMPDVVREEYQLPLRGGELTAKERNTEKRTSGGMGSAGAGGGRGGRTPAAPRQPRPSRSRGGGGPGIPGGFPGAP